MRRKIDLFILLIVVFLGAFAANNAVSLGDWWHAKKYTPPTEIVELSENAGMNDAGKNLFYRFEPQLRDEQELAGLCDVKKLGCIEGRFIYLLKPKTKAEHQRTVVTAAHEMLHAAYSRLSNDDKRALESLLEGELAKGTNSGIVQKLKVYPKNEYYNEAHSFIGSETAYLSPALELHYSKYFFERNKSTKAHTDSL